MSRVAEPAETIRVLAVDDDREIGRELADYLGRFGMRVRVLASGAELRRELRPGQHDVLLLA
jgi:DNA-binding response OmpR family regulator